jgi:RIO kinase 1
MNTKEEPAKTRVQKRVDYTERRLEKEQKMLIKDRSAERAVLEEVLDRSTLMTIYDLLNKGKIAAIYGTVKSGKESRIYWGKASNGKELAIKIFLTVSAEFKRGMLPYIKGDPRFTHVRGDTRSLVYTWAQKEFKNLQRMHEAGIMVPKPVDVSKNVLIMDFIGKNGVPAPILKDTHLKNPKRFYHLLLICLKKLHRIAGLVHADLSEYNIMIWKSKPILFDVSQSVPLEHPMADHFLRRDIENLNKYFKKLDVTEYSTEEVYRRIVSGKT